MPANHQQSDYKPNLVLASNNTNFSEVSQAQPSTTKKTITAFSPSIDFNAILENTPSFYKMTNKTDDHSRPKNRGVCNGDDDAGVFEDLELVTDSLQALTIDSKP